MHTQPIYTDCRNCGTADHSNYPCPCACHKPVNCPACDGSGWTVEGWAHASRPENRGAFDWRLGDCATCNGTGAVVQVLR